MEIEQIQKLVTEYKDKAIGFKSIAENVKKACIELDKSWSNSNLTNHAKFYFKEYEEPNVRNRFSKEWGLINGVPNGWIERSDEEVTAELNKRAGISMDKFKVEATELDANFQKLNRTIQLWLTEHDLVDEELVKFEPKSATDYYNDLTPRQHMTRDMAAITSGHYVASHLYFKAVAMYVLNLPSELEELEFKLNNVAIKLNSKTSHGVSFAFWNNVHPIIRKVAEEKFNDGYYMEAVRSGFIELNDMVKRQYKQDTGIEDDGFNLMKLAFGDFSASDSNFVTTFKYPITDVTNRSGKNFQKGFSLITSGSMLGLRNPRAHSNPTDDINEATHLVFLASWLMYKIFDENGNLKTP